MYIYIYIKTCRYQRLNSTIQLNSTIGASIHFRNKPAKNASRCLAPLALISSQR